MFYVNLFRSSIVAADELRGVNNEVHETVNNGDDDEESGIDFPADDNGREEDEDMEDGGATGGNWTLFSLTICSCTF